MLFVENTSNKLWVCN